MAPKTQTERIAILETKVDDIKNEVCGIKDDIKELAADVREALTTKADKEEVDRIRKGLFWALTAALGLLFGIVAYVVQGHIKF